MNSVSDATGNIVATLIKSRLDDAPADGGTPKIVVSSFSEREVQTIVQGLVGYKIAGQEHPVEIVVAGASGSAQIPDHARLRGDRTLAWHRNNSHSGLVLVQLAETSDEGSLRQMFRMTDRSILEDSEHGEVLKLTAERCWAEAAGHGSLPEALSSEIERVHRALTRVEPLALRPWVNYAIAVCSRVAAVGLPVDHSEIEHAIGVSLNDLNLFPHLRLFDDRGRVDRCLERNRFMAEGRAPTGKDAQESYVRDRIDRVDHRAPDGSELSPDAVAELKKTMDEFATLTSPEARARIDYSQYERLFTTESKRLGLGGRVRDELKTVDPVLLDDFDELEIEGPLSEGDYSAATALLEAVTDEGIALADSLTTRLRRRIEKLAVPPASLEDDPLRALLQYLVGLDGIGADVEVRLEIDGDQEPPGDGSRALFAFLWGRTLSHVADASKDGNGASFDLDERLLAVRWPKIRDPESEEEIEEAWSPVPLRLMFQGEVSPRYRFRWGPDDTNGLAAFAALVRGYALPNVGEGGEDLETWCDSLASAMLERESDRSHVSPSAGIPGEWRTIRGEAFGVWARDGLSFEDLEQHVTEWAELLIRARATLVPSNSPVPELDDFLSTDFVPLGPERGVLCATHPMRLRWLSEHLRRLGDYLISALEGAFELNPENESIYFESLRKVSPHRQPPILVSGADVVMAAVREHGFHEEYAATSAAGRPDAWLGAVDDSSIEELSLRIATYLDSFPHKLDGLGLLVLNATDDERLPERLVRGVRKRSKDAILDVHVVAPMIAHRGIATRIGSLGESMSRDDHLLPGVRVMTHEWPEDWDEFSETLGRSIDVAIVPNLFGAETRLQQTTRPSELGRSGRFEPWLHQTSHTTRLEGRTDENVSRVLLPEAPDPISEAWSTLSVRRFRQSPVSPDAVENTDYFTLQVTFDRKKELFNYLHKLSHWVVTLDPFVGRDQIDALQDPPDVILVRSGLGKNKTHTLVVSSRSGRKFMVPALARRLSANLSLVAPEVAEPVATRIYEAGRTTVPGVMLRALGVGRTLEELVGLVTTRYAVQDAFPPPAMELGVEWWISLDDHLAWFGGVRPLRADLLQVRFVADAEPPELGLRVIESKFRRKEDIGSAEAQLERTADLFRAALAPSDAAETRMDVEFWRRELLTALDEAPRRIAPESDLPSLRWFGEPQEAEEAFRSAIGEGRYSLSVDSLVCALASELDEMSPGGEAPGGSPILKLPRPRIVEILTELRDRVAPGLMGPPPVVHGPSDEEPAHGVDESTAEPGPPVSPTVRAPRPGVETPGLERPQGLDQAELDLRYQRVLDAFHEFNILVEKPEVDYVEQGPSFYRVRLVPGRGVPSDRLINKASDLKLRLGLPSELNLRTFLDRGAVVYEVPKLESERYLIEAQALWELSEPDPSRLAAVVGVDIGGLPVSVDFSSADTPHLLIAGTTGSGKSVALETILRGLCDRFGPDELRLHLVDPKGTELVDFEQDPHLQGSIGIDAEDAIAALDTAVDEMQRRYALFKENRVRSLAEFNAEENVEALPWWLFVLDEYADLTSDPAEKKDLEALLKRLSQKARAAGIHLIVATQRPSADVISSVVRSNLPAQLALRVRDANDSRVILGESGAEALAGNGDAILRTQRGLMRIQCAIVARESP